MRSVNPWCCSREGVGEGEWQPFGAGCLLGDTYVVCGTTRLSHRSVSLALVAKGAVNIGSNSVLSHP